jgi:LPXTG-site transpeptidase (sortase) family protein
MALLSLLLLGYSGFGFWQEYSATHQKDPFPDSQTVVSKNVDQPNETPLDVSAAYAVPADQPRQIIIPSINTQGFIQKVGVTLEGEMAVPTNVHLAGWYSTGVVPGEKGVSVINGHVQGFYRDGVFKRLNALRPGDMYQVEFGDGSRRDFKVVSVNQYNLDKAEGQMFEAVAPIEQQLTLITCAGVYDKDLKTYDQRVIVVSEHVRP